ncbi:hypothetical protein AXX17_AT5G30190 [Arabidopsis thaliana]|uniref:Uncharacterized protein n=1 Tax=Arabidopsis thaliana TaxID=3702 RepID=A0A178UC23_ARATH|nr:hypothetical protein AXX17_AT5G30190 [Arabidopsis thaliana]
MPKARTVGSGNISKDHPERDSKHLGHHFKEPSRAGIETRQTSLRSLPKPASKRLVQTSFGSCIPPGDEPPDRGLRTNLTRLGRNFVSEEKS